MLTKRYVPHGHAQLSFQIKRVSIFITLPQKFSINLVLRLCGAFVIEVRHKQLNKGLLCEIVNLKYSLM